MENKNKHLEFIQDSIERMASHSFSLKRWGVTIVTAIVTLGITEKNTNILLISVIPIVLFWILDGFYLFKERLYRRLYEKVRKLTENEIDFEMNTRKFIVGRNTWIRSIFSRTLTIFYFTLILSMLSFIAFLK
jgi:hypothetical protein